MKSQAMMFDDDEPTEVLDTLGDLIVTPVVAVPQDAPLSEVHRLLITYRVAAIAVVDEAHALRGVITRTDVLRSLEAGDAPSAGDAMSGAVFALPARSAIERAAALMAYEGVGAVVVTGAHGELLGLVSALDIARHYAIASGYLVA